jgi:hypothetical protein
MFENDYTLNGKHATYLKYLANKNSKDDVESSGSSAMIFERYIDVYMNSVVWGLLYGRVVKRDTSSEDRARIYADAFANERENCIFLYRMAMLLDKTTELSSTERVDRAFRYDTQVDKAEELKSNLDLFHGYVRGGIELLYEQFTDGCTTRDDYLNKSYEVLQTFKKEIEGLSFEVELEKLIK